MPWPTQNDDELSILSPSSGNILLVGPDTIWRRRATEHLCDRGFRVESKETVEEALRRVRSAPDIHFAVISDEGNEAEDFPAVSRMVRARPAMQVLLLTAETDLATTMKYLRSICNLANATAAS